MSLTRTTRSGDPRGGGQALAEFALVVPLFFLLVFGIIQLALVFGAQNGITNAVREGTRYASTYRVTTPTDAAAACRSVADAVMTMVRQATPGFDAARVGVAPGFTIGDVRYDWSPNPGGGNAYVTVSVGLSYRHPLYVPIIGGILDGFDGSVDNAFKLSASEQMRIENPPLPMPSPSFYECAW